MRIPLGIRGLAAVLLLGAGACAAPDPSPSKAPTAPPATARPTAQSTPSPTIEPTRSPTISPAQPPATPGATAPATPPPTPTLQPQPTDPTRARIALQRVLGGLDAPLFATGAGDGSNRLFVVERGGRIRIADEGGMLDRPFLDIGGRIVAGGERGLLGLAFHPDYATNGRLYVNYTNRSGDTVVSEFTVSATNPNRASPDSERILMRIDQPYGNHNGGMVAFGPDRLLYIGMGDGGSGGDPQNFAQDRTELLGKMLRIDVDARTGTAPYGIPAGNPFADGARGRPEIWSFGLRNPWRFSFDRADGTLWIGDVGQGSWEEVNREPAGSGGRNYGWRVMEGAHCYSTSGCNRTGMTLPVAEYSHDEGCSITGGYVYRGTAVPALRGAYLFSDYCSGTIWALVASESGRQTGRVLLESGQSISSFGQDDAGELYVADISGGTVSRVIAAP